MEFEIWFDLLVDKMRSLGWNGPIDRDTAREEYESGKDYDEAAVEWANELLGDDEEENFTLIGPGQEVPFDLSTPHKEQTEDAESTERRITADLAKATAAKEDETFLTTAGEPGKISVEPTTKHPADIIRSKQYLFPFYVLSEHENNICEMYENLTGDDLCNTEDVTDAETFCNCLINESIEFRKRAIEVTNEVLTAATVHIPDFGKVLQAQIPANRWLSLEPPEIVPYYPPVQEVDEKAQKHSSAMLSFLGEMVVGTNREPLTQEEAPQKANEKDAARSDKDQQDRE